MKISWVILVSIVSVEAIFFKSNQGKDIFTLETPQYERSSNDPTKAGYPVIMVPGFGGSRLQAKLDGKPSKPHWICDSVTSDFFEIWLNLQLFTPLVVDCFVDNMKMSFNTTTRQCVNNIGVETRVKSFGTDTDLVEWLDTVKFPQAKYFATIADALVSWGYVRGESLRAAPFDWRLKPTDLDPFYNQLKALIQQTSWNNNNQKVVLIGHSMGNIHVNYFLRNYVSQAFRDRYIQSHVAIAAPWSGSMQIVKLLASGYNMEFYRVLLSPFQLREMERSWGSSFLLFPSEPAWKRDEIFAFNAVTNYTLNNVKEFFDDLDFSEGYDHYLESQRNTELMHNVPDVTTHCIHGSGIETSDVYGWSNGYFPDYQPDKKIIGNGDGTVNMRSLELCKTWATLSNRITSHEIEKTDHLGVLYHPKTISLIKNFLYKNV